VSNNQRKKYIAINYGIPGPVVFSQLIEYTLQMGIFDMHFDYNFLMSGKSYFTKNAQLEENIQQLKKKAKGKVSVFPTPFVNKIPMLYLYSFFIKYMSCHKDDNSKTIIHPRGLPSALIANYMRERDDDVSYIYDMRGDSLAEFAYQNRKSPDSLEQRMQLYKALEEKAVHGAGHVICVSNALKEIVLKRYKIDSKKVTVIPCCADANLFKPDLAKRVEVRKHLKLDDQLNLIYCGGLNMWHCAEEMFQLIGGVLQAVTEAFFIVLTPHRSDAFRLAEKYLPKHRYLIDEVSRNDVPKYMLASDIGVILRQNTAVNKASSPTKIAEYLIAGLPVILTGNIGDYSKLIIDSEVGFLLRDDPIDVVKDLSPLIKYVNKRDWPERDIISDFGIDNFSKAKFIPCLKDIYDSI